MRTNVDPAIERQREIFLKALEKATTAERAAYLDGACAGDAALRAELDRLLQHHTEDSFLESPALAGEGTIKIEAGPSESPGRVIGRYKLLQKIGEGGCGVVYMAEQEEPVRRRVALKIIKLGMDTAQVIARFEAERQALAMMDHPNIARILDGGVTETGRPYFVMDLVQGLPIIQFCDEAHLSTRHRLELFLDVCSAVQHAHQKGIIHRDLKPSNILVTLHGDKPMPKVIDFGIAKATQQRLTDKTLFTQFQQFIGTPAYMSPEQATLSGLDIDTRSDIYSLGVLLYELLTGKTPFDARELLQAGLDEMRRTLREQEPERPSTKVSTLGGDELTTTAKRRGLDAPKLVNVLRGDLDWIVMKCLEKDRARRYETATGLASDIQRHLNSEPVTACPPSNAYRFQKMVRRNKLAFAAVTAVALSLILGLGISTALFLREKAARLRANAAERKAATEVSKSRQVTGFFQELFKSVGPEVARGKDITLLKEILTQASQRIGLLTNQPEIEAEIRSQAGEIFRSLGDYTNAEVMQKRVIEIEKLLSPTGSEDLATALNNLANTLTQQGDRIAEAEGLNHEALTMMRRLAPAEDLHLALLINNFAVLLETEGKFKEAEDLEREALSIRTKVLGPDHPETAGALHNLAKMLAGQGKFADVEKLYRDALQILKTKYGEDHPDVANCLGNLAAILQEQGNLAPAEEMLTRSLAIRRRVLGSNHPDIARSLDGLGSVLQAQGKLAEAEKDEKEALKIARTALGNTNLFVALLLNNLANVLTDELKLDEAERARREFLEIHRKLQGKENANIAHGMVSLADVLGRLGREGEAEDLFVQGIEMQRKVIGQDHPDISSALNNFARFLSNEGKFAEAEPLYREALEMNKRLRGSENPQTAINMINLASVLCEQFKRPSAEDLQREALAMDRKLLGNEHPDVAFCLNHLALNLAKQGKHDEAETNQREALRIQTKLAGEDNPDTLLYLNNLADIIAGAGRLDSAEQMARETLTRTRQKFGDTNQLVAGMTANLGSMLVRQHKLDEAQKLFDAFLPTSSETQLNSALLFQRRGELYARRGQWKNAAADLNHALKIRPTDSQLWHLLAPVLVENGEQDQYRAHCRKEVERFGKVVDVRVAHRIAKDCLILPSSGTESQAILQLITTSLDGKGYPSSSGAFLAAKGLAEYRQNRFSDAAAWLQKVLVGQAETNAAWVRIETLAVLAMAQQQLGQHDAARATLTKGLDTAHAQLPALESGDLGDAWLDWIISNVLLREATDLIENGKSIQGQAQTVGGSPRIDPTPVPKSD